MTAGEYTPLAKGVDLHTFGPLSNYGGDSTCSWIPVEVQPRERRHKRADALALPPSVLPAEYRRRDGGGGRVSCIGSTGQTTAGLSAQGHRGGGGKSLR